MKLKVNDNGRIVPKGAAVIPSLSYNNIALKPVDYFTDQELYNVPTGSVFTYDIEVYPNFFYIAFKCIKTGKVFDFEISPAKRLDPKKLVWAIYRFCIVGFNSRKFDIYLLLRSLDPNVTNAQLKELSDDIIQNELMGFAIEKKYNLTVPNINHIDLIEVCPLSASLKAYGGRLHSKRLQDLPFPEYKHLTEDDATIVRNYCANDLDLTQDILTELSEQLSLRETLSKEYNIDLRSKSDAQVAEAVIGKEIAKITGSYPRKPTILAGTKFRYLVPDFVSFQTPVLQKALSDIAGALFEVSASGEPTWPEGLGVREKGKDGKYRWIIKIPIGDSVYKMGMGGLHSTEKSIAHIATPSVVLSDHDAESYYPRNILNQRLYPSHLGPAFLQVYETIVDRRVAAKRSGNKIVADSLKITINGTFGKLGSKYSIIYAPDLLLQVTLSGQLNLLMLIEMFELNGISVISANTDGIIVKCPVHMLELRDQIIKTWEKRTSFKTEETRYLAVYSRDINNYIAVKQDFDKETKSWLPQAKGCKFKGAYANPWADESSKIFRFNKNPEATICIEAAAKFIEFGTPIEDTILNDKDIKKFVCVRNVKGGGHKDGQYLGKVVRWYYAEGDYTPIKYVGSGNKVPKSEGASPIMDLPDYFPNNVNYDWYIKETTEILSKIGCIIRSENSRLI